MKAGGFVGRWKRIVWRRSHGYVHGRKAIEYLLAIAIVYRNIFVGKIWFHFGAPIISKKATIANNVCQMGEVDNYDSIISNNLSISSLWLLGDVPVLFLSVLRHFPRTATNITSHLTSTSIIFITIATWVTLYS
jgi:hypothetical protein